jgi:hypothetical protein
VATLDLGAPDERLRTYPYGHRLAYALVTDPAALNDWLLAVDISAQGRVSGPIQATTYNELMRGDCGFRA